MDIQIKDILKQLLERLDKMEDSQQHKLDRVIERVDTLQNILERQNQKQNLLDQMLLQMTVKLQKDTVVTNEQIQGAQQEIIEPFRVIDNQSQFIQSPHKTAQSLQSGDKQIDEQLKSIEDRTVETSQKCHQLTSWSLKMEEKMTELAGNSAEMVKMFLVEIRSVKDLIKGQTNSELIWLNNQIDKKLSDIGSVVSEIYQQQTKAREDTGLSTGQRVKTDMKHRKQQGDIEPLNGKPKLSMELCDQQMQVVLGLDRKIDVLNSSVLDMSRNMKTYLDTILTTNKQSIIDLENRMSHSVEEMNERCKEQSLLMNKTLKSDLNKHVEVVQSELQTNRKTFITETETQTNRIICAAETAKEDLRCQIQIEGDNARKYKVEMESLHSLINSLLNSMQKNLETVVEKVDSTEASMINKHQTVNKKLEELTTDLKDYIYKTKREIFAVTEKEAQIVRDRIQGPLPCPGKYTFDFYVTNFKTLVRSGKDVDSLPWHINELQTCVTGRVTMSTDGEMEVWILFGRHARELGLQPRSGKTLRVKATIFDICKKILPPVDVGEVSWSLDEEEIHWNGGFGLQVGMRTCDVLSEGGYGKQEEYDHGALLIRYEVKVQ